MSAPLRDAQLRFNRAQLAPEALVGVDQAAACAAVLARALRRPREAPHEVRDDQSCGAAHARAAMHQDRCARTQGAVKTLPAQRAKQGYGKSQARGASSTGSPLHRCLLSLQPCYSTEFGAARTLASGAGALNKVVGGREEGRHVLRVHIRQLKGQPLEARRQAQVLRVVVDRQHPGPARD